MPKPVFAQSSGSAKRVFDQRQIALLKIDGTDFPDELTVAEVLDEMKRRGRVRWVTAKGAPGAFDPILVPKDFSWHTPSSVKSLGLRYKVDGLFVLIRNGVQLETRWYSVSDGLPLFLEKLTLPDASPDQLAERSRRLKAWVQDMWNRIPGSGFVVSRDLKLIRVEGASEALLNVGDSVEFLRFLQVKRHPLLKTLMEVETSLTGKGRVVSIENPFAALEVEYESQVDPIQVGDRFRILPRVAKTESSGVLPNAGENETESASDEFGRRAVSIADYGILGPGAWLSLGAAAAMANVSHVDTTTNGDELVMNRNFAPAVELMLTGELTKQWFLYGRYQRAFFSFDLLPSDYVVSTLKSGFQQLRVGTQYRLFLPNPTGTEVGDPIAFQISAGFRGAGLDLEDSSSVVAPSGKSYQGFEIGLGVRLPLFAKTSLDFDLYRHLTLALTESGLSSGSSSNNMGWGGRLGFVNQIDTQDRWGGAIDFMSWSSAFTGSGTRSVSSESSTTSALYLSVFYQRLF